jgi:hypothetical protein
MDQSDSSIVSKQMNKQLHKAVEYLIHRAEAASQSGERTTAQVMRELNKDMGERIPAWYVELLVGYSLAGLEIGWQADDPNDDYDGVAWMQWSDPKNIRSESLECYPGLAILERGWINVASDIGGSDPYFIPTDRGDDPPVFQVYHDVSDQADVILAEGCRQVAPSLSELFLKAKLPTS